MVAGLLVNLQTNAERLGGSCQLRPDHPATPSSNGKSPDGGPPVPDHERHQEWLRAAQKMTQLLVSGIDAEEALRIVVAELRSVSGAAGAVILLVDSAYQDETGTFAAVDGLGLEPLRGTTVPLQGLALTAINSGRAIVSEDMTLEDDLPPQVVQAQVTLGLGMYLPLIAAGKTLGVLIVGWRRDSVHEHIAAKELSLVEIFAGQAALAIRQAHERGLIVADRARVATILREQTIARIQALDTHLRGALTRTEHESAVARQQLQTVIEELDEATHQIRSAIFMLDPSRRSETESRE
ncbi:GAF domain-containing protein [Actinopolymorpha pittospori]|uniref:Uncharacterized protein YoaH (UPF0181 family) n=1 Tax=Actinopolymorpha pittospori TaxID=648752 RepID=A0A927N6S1_9ACTN|nr:GAF domain-containing protein [Actinopolymorpha pittospori]MBE1610002.1 uncharacterized protein YoaH (UPF0181 family) [Actinopolymorpha pittospori]